MGTLTLVITSHDEESIIDKEHLECGYIPDITLWWNRAKEQWESDTIVEQYPKPIQFCKWTGDAIMKIYNMASPSDEEVLQQLIRALQREGRVVHFAQVVKPNEANITLTVCTLNKNQAERIAYILNDYQIKVNLKIELA